jgi:hypothetical protein
VAGAIEIRARGGRPVQPKAAAHPTDARLTHRAIIKLIVLAICFFSFWFGPHTLISELHRCHVSAADVKAP